MINQCLAYYFYMRLAGLFFIFLQSIIFPASCQVKDTAVNQGYQNIGKKVSYYEDKTAALSIAQIKSIDSAGKFAPGKQEILNFGNTSSAIWIKINPPRHISSQAYLVVDAPNIEHIDCFLTHANGSIKQMSSGCFSYTSADVSIESNFVFKLFQEKGNLNPIYLRLQTNNIMLVPLKIAGPEAIMKGKASKDRIEYIYIGVLMSLLLFNLFLFTSLRDVTYLYYTIYVLTLSSYLLIYIRGYGFLFGDELRIFFNAYPHVFLSLSMVSSLAFCSKFLNLSNTVPFMTRVYYFLGCCAIVLFVTSISGNKSLSAAIAQVLTVTLSVVVWVSGVIAYKRGHKPAKYYIIAWFFIWITVGLVTFSLAGIIKSSEFTMQVVPIGSTIELLLLSFALGDRYKIIIKAEQDLRDEHLLLVQTQNQRLEDVVKERTAMLSKTISELEASNAVKNKLFSIIAHDLRSPLNSLISMLSLNDMEALTMEDIQLMLKENKKNIETIYNTLNNLLHWAKSQMNGIKTEPGPVDLKVLIEELILVYAPLMQKKGITAILNIPTVSPVYADENHVKLILRNLIDNAIKFTPKSKQVTITIRQQENKVKVMVSNAVENAAEIDASGMMNKNSIAPTYGTENEKGVGLGLLLCREYIKSNGGELDIVLEADEISLSFLLPVA